MCIAALTLFAAVPIALASSKWYVDGVNGNDSNNCESTQTACKTIGHAISLASRGDFISVSPATYAENLTIPFSLKIVGSSAATTIIDGGGVASVVLSSNPTAHVTLSHLTMRNGSGGKGGDGGAIYNKLSTMTISHSIISGSSVSRGNGALGYGGGIYNTPGSTLTVINSTFSRNSAEEGGAICNGGILTINKSTFAGSVARHRKGGGIRNYGTLTITNSTISGNRASGVGGGIYNGQLVGQMGTLAINNSTVSGNIAGDGKGGNIFNLKGTTATLQNTIIANSPAGGNCGGHGTLTSNGYNLSSDDSCHFDGPGDLNNTDPKLGPLGDNGGPTHTMALVPGSPAIDSGNPDGCTDGHGHLLKTDQRGRPRPDKEDTSGCDRGAYERQQKPGLEVLYGFASTSLLNLSLTTTIDASTGGFGPVSVGPTPFFANGAAVASNSKFLYISNSFIDGQPNNGSQIFGYLISPADGTLTPIAGSPFFLFPPPSSIQGLAITPDGQFLYGADFTGFIYAFNIEDGTGVPTLVPGSPFASGPNAQLAVDPAGRFLYASNDNDPVDSILAFTIEPSGALTPVPHSPFKIPGRTGGTSEPYGIVDTGNFVYTALVTNQIAGFSVDGGTGALTPLPSSPFPAGSAPSFFALANNFLYAQNADGSISGYSVDPTTGALTPLPDSPFKGLNAGTLATDPLGNYLYVGTFKGIQGYNIDPSTGALSLGSANFGEGGTLWLTTVLLPSSAAP